MLNMQRHVDRWASRTSVAPSGSNHHCQRRGGRASHRCRPGKEIVMGARVLVVDDDPSIVRAVVTNLRVRGYEALTAASGETDQPDCIVLDLGLPGIDGLEVLRRLRTWTLTPVVILTAVDGERDKAT